MGDAAKAVTGPACEIDLGDVALPLWIVPFDAAGACIGPETRQAVLGELASGGYTDIFLFSHGWNNAYEEAKDKYTRFITGYHDLVTERNLTRPSSYRPLMVGVLWPSIALLLPSEKAPEIAGAPESGAMISLAQESLDDDDARRAQALAEQPGLTDGQAFELARLLAPSYPDDDELNPNSEALRADDVMQIWRSLLDASESSEDEEGPEAFGRDSERQRPAAAPEAAGLRSLLRFDPRDILRAFTVYKMKDRAGHVGATGVSELLRDMLSANGAPAVGEDPHELRYPRIHLIGHSYGARVLLSALCAEPLPRPAQSLLLLEPAVNYLCFARQVPLSDQPGGYRAALECVAQPILSTFSSHDRALHDFFHLAVRRDVDLGEPKIAGLGKVPSLYCALGGWGPGGLDPDEVLEVPLKSPPNVTPSDPPDRYELQGVSYKVYALNGENGITGHSDVINRWTFWALYNLVAG